MPKAIDLIALGGWPVLDHIAVMPRLPETNEILFEPGFSQQLEQSYWGGCTVNIAITAATLGLVTRIAVVVGNDFKSGGYATHLENQGVHADVIGELSGQRCPHCFQIYDQNGNKFSVMDAPLEDDIDYVDLSDNVFKNTRSVVIVGGSTDHPQTPYLIRNVSKAKKAGCIIAYSGPFTTDMELFAFTDILIFNQYEAEKAMARFNVTKIKDLPSLGPSLIFVTHRDKGSIVYRDKHKELHVPAIQTRRVVDPTGAGDSYSGAVIAALLQDRHPAEAAMVGSTVSSFVIEEIGCQTNLPTWKTMSERYLMSFGSSI